jgi:CRISPR-associated protein Csm3
MSGFAEFRNRTWIHAILEMQTALAVGSRLSLDPVGTDMPVIKDPEGKPFIPGSSIKGVVRFQAERMLRAVNRKPDFWACDPFDAPCVDASLKETLWKRAGQNDEIFTREVFSESCTACRLFGSPWMAGRVAFKDARLENHEDLPVWTQIRDGVGIDRDLGAARAGVKYDFETVVPGAQFRIEIMAENLENWELGFLLAVLRMWKEGGIAIGGKSTRGPGWGKLTDIQIYQVTPDNLLDYLSSGQKAERKEDELIEAFMSWWKREGGHA